MYLSSFQKMREKLIDSANIIALIDTRGSNAHPDVFDANAGWVFQPSVIHQGMGAYFKLDQGVGEPKRDAYLEAIRNPGCGWFYRVDAARFRDIPGAQIAYWASESMQSAFRFMTSLKSLAEPKVGGQTNDNDRFIRYWWEPSISEVESTCTGIAEAGETTKRWFPFNKGGSFRKWYGNRYLVVNWANLGQEILAAGGSTTNSTFYFLPSITWSRTSSGALAVRYISGGFIFDTEGASLFGDEGLLSYLQGLLNSSVQGAFLALVSPTLHFGLSEISVLPVADCDCQEDVISLVNQLRGLSQFDWNRTEISGRYLRNALVCKMEGR